MSWHASQIVIHNWPDLHQLDDGRWSREWEITLKAEPAHAEKLAELAENLSSECNEVKFAFDGKKLKVRVVSSEWGWEPAQYTLSYGMLESVDREVGEIETIQGQPRDLWNPWLRIRQDSEYSAS